MIELPLTYNKPAQLSDAQIDALVKVFGEFARKEAVRIERRRLR